MSQDRYARSEYRRLIAWEGRIRREAPLFERLLAEAPERSVLDVGCGTGEHVAWFARAGARAVGLDSSPSMLESARDHEKRGEGRFLEGDALGLGTALRAESPFGLALCLGNMLPHVLEESDLARLAAGVRDALLPGGIFLLQFLNYARILDGGVRALPVNFAEGDRPGEEIVFLRLMSPVSPSRLLFFPTTLHLDPSADPPLTVKASHRVELRPWRAEEVREALGAAGFEVELAGDMTGAPYDAALSPDAVAIARKR